MIEMSCKNSIKLGEKDDIELKLKCELFDYLVFFNYFLVSIMGRSGSRNCSCSYIDVCKVVGDIGIVLGIGFGNWCLRLGLLIFILLWGFFCVLGFLELRILLLFGWVDVVVCLLLWVRLLICCLRLFIFFINLKVKLLWVFIEFWVR